MIDFMKKSFLLGVFFNILLVSSLYADESPWPKEFKMDKHTLVIYQPQPESLIDNKLKVLSAISVESEKNSEPIFGAIWSEAEVDIDKSDNIAHLHDFKLIKLQFASDKAKQDEKIQKLIEKKFQNLTLYISYQKLLSSLEIKDMQKKESQKIKTEAPHIIVTQTPSVLITIDGEPRLKPIKETKLYRVINTPYTIIMDSTTNSYYLNADENVWYSAKGIKETWSIDKNVPQNVKKYEVKPKAKNVKKQTGEAPKIIVATKPTELISCKGKPEFTPIDKTSLMYVSNTESDLFIEIKSQQYYVLLAGRWYKSKTLEKGWKYIKSTDLPKTFSKIPSDSDSSNVLYAISGTKESKDAVLDAQIPQTASVNRKKAQLNVTYDGSPQYSSIAGTNLSYIKNTQTPVIYFKEHYYACDNGIWFDSSLPDGKWNVATSIPNEIYSIPSSSPMYSVTFVRIYKVTEDTVYVGYTAGYTNTYVYNTTIVYGTGYYYTPWYGNYYYPYPSPWGFHVRWNPWYGWGFGLSYSSGPFTFYMGGGGWYGPGYWGRMPYYGYGHGYHRGYHNGFRQGYIRGRIDGHRPHAGTRPARDRNLYKSKENRSRIKDTKNRFNNKENLGSNLKSNRVNNVFADKNGAIHRKVDNGWQKRTNSGWESKRDSSALSNNNLNRNFESRNRGNNFSRGSFSGGRSNFGGGGFSGGRGGFGGGGGRLR